MSFKVYTTLLCFSYFIWGCRTTEAAQILALFVNGHHSHLLVYASVVNLLIDRGHNLTVVTTLDVSDIILNIERVRWLKLSDKYTQNVITATTGDNGLNQIERMLKRIEGTSRFMDDALWRTFLNEETQYDLIIMGYLFNDYQLGLGAHFKSPVVVIWTGQPIGFIQRLVGNPEERWYVPQPYDSHQYTGLKAILFGWFEKFVEVLALEKMKEIYDKQFPETKYPSFREIRKSVSLVLCNHHSLSEGPIAPYLPGVIEMGGIEIGKISAETEFSLVSKITPNANVIYLSFGSRVKWSLLPTSLEETFIEAFKVFPNYTIIWTYDKNCTELQLKFPSSNVKCDVWWPQSSILAFNQTKLFITHGGKGSISQAQLYGIPMLGIPFFGDQIVNVAKMVDRKLGQNLHKSNITVEKLVKVLRELLQNEIYENNVERFSKLFRDRPISNENNVIYWLEYVLRYKGAKHLQSPAKELNFFQLYLLDVYFFICMCLFTLLKICNFLERNLKRF